MSEITDLKNVTAQASVAAADDATAGVSHQSDAGAVQVGEGVAKAEASIEGKPVISQIDGHSDGAAMPAVPATRQGRARSQTVSRPVVPPAGLFGAGGIFSSASHHGLDADGGATTLNLNRLASTRGSVQGRPRPLEKIADEIDETESNHQNDIDVKDSH